MANNDLVITRHAEVSAVLADERFVVPVAEGGAPRGSLAWLRGAVCRFSEGAEHDRRLDVVARSLDEADPARLRRRTRERILAGEAPDLAPISALGEALGVTDLDALTGAVPAAASGYLTGTGRDGADAAVAALARTRRSPTGSPSTSRRTRPPPGSSARSCRRRGAPRRAASRSRPSSPRRCASTRRSRRCAASAARPSPSAGARSPKAPP
ncbi:hypothetical protein ABT299_18570 [Spirillospora sp. NPDC000708]